MTFYPTQIITGAFNHFTDGLMSNCSFQRFKFNLIFVVLSENFFIAFSENFVSDDFSANTCKQVDVKLSSEHKI